MTVETPSLISGYGLLGGLLALANNPGERTHSAADEIVWAIENFPYHGGLFAIIIFMIKQYLRIIYYRITTAISGFFGA